MIEGWEFFLGNKSLLELFFQFVLLNLLMGFSINIPLPYIINEVLKMPPSQFGIINAMLPIGLIIGTLTVEFVMKIVEFRKLCTSMIVVISLLASLIGLPVIFALENVKSLVLYCFINLMIGVAIASVDVPVMTILQSEVPRELLGRVLSLIMSLVKALVPVAFLCSGALIEIIPVEFIPLTGSVIPFIYSIYSLNSNSTESLLNNDANSINM